MIEATQLGSKVCRVELNHQCIGQGNAHHWMSYDRDVLCPRKLGVFWFKSLFPHEWGPEQEETVENWTTVIEPQDLKGPESMMLAYCLVVQVLDWCIVCILNAIYYASPFFKIIVCSTANKSVDCSKNGMWNTKVNQVWIIIFYVVSTGGSDDCCSTLVALMKSWLSEVGEQKPSGFLSIHVGLWEFDGFITDTQFLHSGGILDMSRNACGNIPDKTRGTAEPRKAVPTFRLSVTEIDKLRFQFNPPWCRTPSPPCSGFLLTLWTWAGLTDTALSISPAFDFPLHTRYSS